MTTTEKTWSLEQQTIFNWFKTSLINGILFVNLVIKAYAGTGKTTTIKEAFTYALMFNPAALMLYAVFNKKNQVEAEQKIKHPQIHIKTLHALGFYFIKQIWRNAKPDTFIEAERLAQTGIFIKDADSKAMLLKLVSLAKNLFINPTVEDLEQVCLDRDIDFTGTGISNPCEIVLQVLEISKIQDSQNRISFDDMVWLPCAKNIVQSIYDLVCIDEAQDMNAPQLEMAKRACKKTGRVVVVGDSRQAIYGFRGAVDNAMDKMKDTLNAGELTLSTTYRCPIAVVKEANKIVSDYKHAENAPNGTVYTMGESKMMEKLIVGDAILSRLNAPLMRIALAILKTGKAARIEGKDIAQQLIALINKMKASSVPNFIDRVTSWENQQVRRLVAAKASDSRIEQTRDTAETLRVLAQDAVSVDSIKQTIKNLFEEDNGFRKPCVVLSSVHKAKGLEWKNVYVLINTFKHGKGIIEEDNIYYVAVTRAMENLIYVTLTN